MASKKTAPKKAPAGSKPAANKHQASYHARMVAAGNTRFSAWIPKERREEASKAIERLRKKWNKEAA